jgi:hypothetical protein
VASARGSSETSTLPTRAAGAAFAERLREARAVVGTFGGPEGSPAGAVVVGGSTSASGVTASGGPAALVRARADSPVSTPSVAVAHPGRETLASAVARAVQRLVDGGRYVDGAMRAARRGELTNEQLLAIQAGVYRYTQELELAAKVVDKTTSGVKQVIQSQQ